MRSKSEKNHMIKHQAMEHQGAGPEFTMKVIKYYRTPLARQVAEAVRIRRRGGREPYSTPRGSFHVAISPD